MTVPARKRRVTASLKHLQWVRCETSGKRGYWSRGDAKTARSRQRFEGLHIYRCADCGRFHLGHLPLLVTSGVVTRGDYYDAVRERTDST